MSHNPSETILLSGYYGAMNIGDEAILYGALDSLSNHYSEINVASVEPSRTAKSHEVETIPTLTQEPLTWLSKLREVDELFIGGGGLLEPKNTAKYGIMVSLALLSRTKVSWYCVGVSPTPSIFDEKVYRSVLEASDYVSVRDAESRNELRTAGVSSNIDVIPDPAFRTDALPSADFETPPSYICVVLRKCDWRPIDKTTLATALDQIVRETGTPILFTPFEDRPDDWETIQKTQEIMEEDSLIYDGEITVGRMNYLIKNSNLVIGMRLHSIILAAANRIPSVTLSYAEKCDRITSQIYDYSALDCGQFSEEDLVRRAINRIQSAQDIPVKTTELREQAGSIPSNRDCKKTRPLDKVRLVLLTVLAVFNWAINYKWRSN